MANTKNRERVTFSVPTYLLELADMQAEALGLDRYEVIRMALGQGLMVLRLNQELHQNPKQYLDELRALTNDEPGAFGGLQDKLAEGTVESIKKQKKKRDAA